MRLITILLPLILLVQFAPATPAAEPRAELSLDGQWQFRAIAPDELADVLPSNDDAWIAATVPAQRWPRMDALRAWHRRDISIPADWNGKRLFIRFEAVAYGCRAWLDERELGAHLGGFTPFEFELPAPTAPGKHCLTVLAEGFTALVKTGIDKSSIHALADLPADSLIAPLGAYGEDQYRGITDSVTLLARPHNFISDVFIQPRLAESQLRLDYELDAPEPDGLRLSARLFDPEGREPQELAVPGVEPPIIARGRLNLQITVPIRQPRPWTPEDPFVYRLVTELRRGAELLDRRADRFGFREFQTQGNRFLLNGAPRKLRGRGDAHTANQTLYDPQAVREFLAWHMGAANVYRTHLAPKPRRYYETASDLGLMIVAESEIAFDRKYDLENPDFWNNCARIWEERLRRDRNEPAIIIWSVENELVTFHPERKISGRIWALGQKIKSLDPTRPVMFEGDGDLRDRLAAPDPDGENGKPVEIINLHPYDVGRAQLPAREWNACANTPQCFNWLAWDNDGRIPGFWGAQPLTRERPWYIGEFGHAVAAAPDLIAFRAGNRAYEDLFGKAAAFWEAVGENVAEETLAYRLNGAAAVCPWWDLPRNERAEQGWKKVEEALLPVRMVARQSLELDRPAKNTIDLAILYDAPSPGRLRIVAECGPACETTLTAQPGEIIHTQARFKPPDTIPAMLGYRAPLKLTLYHDDKPVHGLSGSVGFDHPFPIAVGAKIILYDPVGDTAAALQKTGVNIESRADLSNIRPGDPNLLVFGADCAEKATPAANAAIGAYIAAGGQVSCLRQTHPLPWLPLRLSPLLRSETSVAFFLHAGSQHTVFPWTNDGVISRGNYRIPTQGNWRAPARVGGSDGLAYSPKLELSVGEGRVTLWQIELPPTPPIRPIIPELNELLSPSRMEMRRFATAAIHAREPLAEILRELIADAQTRDARIQIIEGAQLADAAALRAKAAAGGILLIHNLTPEKEAEASALLGVEIHIRKSELQHPQLEINPHNRIYDAGIANTDLFWLDAAPEPDLLARPRDNGPIVNYVLDISENSGVIIAQEPERTAPLPQTDAPYSFAQFLAAAEGKRIHPGAAIVLVKIGGGYALLDQVLWDKAWNKTERARRVASRLLDNLDIRLRWPRATYIRADEYAAANLKFGEPRQVQPPRVALWCAGDSVEYDLAGLPPGTWRLRLNASAANGRENLNLSLDGRPLAALAIGAGATRETADFQLLPADRRRLTLTMPDDLGDIFLHGLELIRRD